MPKKVTKEVPARLSQTPKGDDEAKIADTGEDLSEEDYLQKYQYVRELPLGDPRTNPRGGKPKIMKESLLCQPKVRIMIPVDSGSDPSVPLSVTLNGYRLDLPRNQYVDVPEQVAEVVMNSQKQTMQAVSQFKIDGNKDKETALS